MSAPNFHKLLPNKPVLDVIFLNGGNNSGKDSLARLFINAAGVAIDSMKVAQSQKPKRFYRIGFADILKSMTHLSRGLLTDPQQFEAVKNLPCREFQGSLPRDAYIEMAERVIKPFYGRSIFARAAAFRIRTKSNKLHRGKLVNNFVVTDLGFSEELIFPFMLASMFDVHVRCHVFNVKRTGSNHDTDARKEITQQDLRAYFIKCLTAIADNKTDFFYDHYVLKHAQFFTTANAMEEIIGFNRPLVQETVDEK